MILGVHVSMVAFRSFHITPERFENGVVILKEREINMFCVVLFHRAHKVVFFFGKKV